MANTELQANIGILGRLHMYIDFLFSIRTIGDMKEYNLFE